jgi:uncharacterized protein YjdB
MTASGRLNAPRRLFGVLAASVAVLGGLVACGGTSTEPSSIAVTGVTLDRSTLTLTVGGSSVALVATVSPSNATNTAVTWSSSNSAVASVSDAGVVSPVALGTATITVATQDGTKTATCAVTVVAATVAVTGVALDKSTLDLVAGGAAVKLVATVTPSNATNKSVIWLPSNNSVATVSSSGEVTPVAAGTATITVKTVDGAKVATCSVKVTAVAVTGVALDKSTLDMVVGGAAVKLVATVTPSDATNKNATWLSSNTSVATVSASGEVTPVAAGTATISVKTVDGAKVATCLVTVAAAPVAVTGVALDKTTLTLTVNSSLSLVATVAPANATDKVVSWFSDKPGIAEVSTAGVVTAKAVGKATVTVTTRDGSFTASCEVTVRLPSKAVTGVALDVTTLDLVVGGSTKKLTATVSPADADNPAVTWSSSDSNVATVDAGVVTAVGSGTAIITVRTAEGQFTATCAVTVHSDTVTSLTAKAQLTGQIALYWTDPVDKNATKIEVTMQSADGPVSRLVEVGKRQTAFSGLTIGTSYTFALRVRGASDITSEQVMATGTPIKVVKVLRNNGDPNDPFYITDTYGSSSSGTETHDIVMARGVEINDPDPKFDLFPMNYRWLLMPGLADPTDSSLVSFKNENYETTKTGDTTTSQWVETDRYLHVHTGGVEDYGQWYNWAHYTPPPLTHVAYADLVDETDQAFNASASFFMVPRADVPGATSFRWLGDSTGNSYLIDHSWHITALDSATIGNRFERDSAWFIEDVTTVTP